jgi:hypothetical protein
LLLADGVGLSLTIQVDEVYSVNSTEAIESAQSLEETKSDDIPVVPSRYAEHETLSAVKRFVDVLRRPDAPPPI